VNNRFWVCCEVRERPHYCYEGYGLEIDWKRRKVIRRLDIPQWFMPKRDRKTAGGFKGSAGNRGLRQMRDVGDYFYALTQGGVLEYYKDTLEERRRFSHNMHMGGHYLVPHEGGFWYNACIFDSLVHIDMDGKILKTIQIAGNEEYAKALEIQHEIHDTSFDIRTVNDLNLPTEYGLKFDQLHMNTIQVIGDEVYVYSLRKSTFFRLLPSFKIILKDEYNMESGAGLLNSHDANIFNDKILVNNSRLQKFHIYDLQSKKLETVIDIPTRGERTKLAYPGYLRGFEKIDNDRVLIGTAPLGVFEINIRKGVIVDGMRFSDEVNHTCHGINAIKE
jgi:hypothetical protein